MKEINPFKNPKRYPLNERGFGMLYADAYQDLWRFVSDLGKPFYYSAGRWKEDAGCICSRRYGKKLVEYLEGIIPGEKKDIIEELSRRSKRETIIKDAQDVHAVTFSDFDANLHLINCLNGTYDLNTGQFRTHDPNDFLSRQANVAYRSDARCDRWTEFIDEIMCGDADLARYLQKAMGYCLSGDTSEECLFIAYGPTTRNGKGTTFESVCNVMGDYARTIQPDSLAQRKSGGSSHSADIARLAGVRLANASELPSDMRLNAAMVKQLTGGDTVTTRFLYQNFFEFRPQFKIFINTNHLPEITDDTLFSSGRLKLIPFDRHFGDNEQDHSLKRLFREDEGRSSILNWLLEGYALYKAEGLEPPERAVNLLKEYRKNSDRVSLYIEERLESCSEKAEKTKTQVVHQDFIKWCEARMVDEMSLKEFVQALRQKDLLGRDRTLGHFIKGYKIRTLTPTGSSKKGAKAKALNRTGDK